MIFDSSPAEESLQQKLKRNPVWPFTEISPHVYQLKVRRKQFYYAIILLLVNTIGVFYLAFVSGEQNVLIINVCIYLVLIYQLVNNYNERVYMLYTSKLIYQFYVGDTLAQENHFHNIYIRLCKQMTSDDRLLVKLVLDGYGIEPYQLSKSSDNFTVMRNLGKKIAKRLSLNYFDMQDLSRQHIIQYKCPQKHKKQSALYKPNASHIGTGNSMLSRVRLPTPTSNM